MSDPHRYVTVLRGADLAHRLTANKSNTELTAEAQPPVRMWLAERGGAA